MNVCEAPLLLTKAKNPIEGHKVNAIVSPLSHPMYLIYINVIVEGRMELG